MCCRLYLSSVYFFFFKQKTAYEMRISDWSSDVCSSDLRENPRRLALGEASMIDSGNTAWILTSTALVLLMTLPGLALFYAGLVQAKNVQIGRASCRGRVWQYV